MIRRRLQFAALLLLAGCALAASAQQGTPHAGYVYPAGGRQGSSFEVLVGGQFLNGVNAATLSGDGVKVSVEELIKPIQPGQASMMRDRLKELTEKLRQSYAPAAKPVKWTDADEKELRDIRTKLALFARRRLVNAALAEQVRLTVKISDNALPGQRELRLETPNGVTNPVYFFVGQLPEWSKSPAGQLSPEEIADLGAPGTLRKQYNTPAAGAPPPPVVDVAQPILVNGQVAQGGVDRYRFTAQKGEHLVIAASAREIIPYIADAVPGWFQASLTLYGPDGREVQYADHYSFHPDPVILYEVPADGQYTVAIHDSIYRGREDFVYRIAIGQIPFVTGIFPLGGRAGAKNTVEFTGWNLPQTRITEHSRDKDKGVELLSAGEEEFTARPFALDTLPETLAKSSIATRASAQKLNLPVIVNGRVSRPGERQYFQFHGKAAQEVEAEVYARRLDSPLDSVLTLMDANGKILASNDDFVDESAGLLTDHADSLLRFKLPADGIYYLRLGDSVGNGGPDFAYRLRVNQPDPDFELRLTPSSISARPGQTVPIVVHVQRFGGFTGDVMVKLKDSPRGFMLSGGTIPGDQNKMIMTLTVPVDATRTTGAHLSLAGLATIGGKDVRRLSIPADDREQAFFFHHLVTTRDLFVTVTGQQRQTYGWQARADQHITLLAGQMVGLKFDMTSDFASHVKFDLTNPPEGITLDHVTPFADGGVTMHIKVDGVKAKAGLRGNLLVTATIDRTNPTTKGKTTVTEMLPAFPFEVFPSTQKYRQTASRTPNP